jgi:branched-chain amino acid aminotransferase
VEVGASNIFFVMKHKDGTKELLTPELDGLILPGVTRDSLIVIALFMQKLAKKKKDLKVTERKIMM